MTHLTICKIKFSDGMYLKSDPNVDSSGELAFEKTEDVNESPNRCLQHAEAIQNTFKDHNIHVQIIELS